METEENYRAMWRYVLSTQYLQVALNMTAQRMDGKNPQGDSPIYASPDVQSMIAAAYFGAPPSISDRHPDYSAAILSTRNLQRKFDDFLRGDHSGLPERIEETRHALKALSTLLESMGDPADQVGLLRSLAERA